MNTKHSAIAHSIVEKIKKGEATMRPRWHFVLRALLSGLGVVILLLSLLYLASFIIFVLRETGVLFVPSFGLRGVGVFLFALPWFLMFITLVFVFVLEVLVRRYAFAYRKPLLYSVSGIMLLVVFGGMFLTFMGFHQGFAHYAKERRVPMAGAFYKSFEHSLHDNVFPGTIILLTDDGFHMRDREEAELDIIITSDTRFPYGVDFVAGDTVVVFGERRGTSTIEAIGVRRMDESLRPPMHRRGWSHRIPPPGTFFEHPPMGPQ
jgi:hypothetical protein